MTSIRRRAVLGGALAGLAAPALPPRPAVGVDGLLGLFRTTPVVALNEGVHHLQETWDFLAAAMFRPGFDAVVIELGNSRHQSVADDYVSGGVVRKSALQRIWRDTTQSPLATGDVAVLFRLLSLARALNLFASRSLRVLLADPPIDWSAVRTRDDVTTYLMRRGDSWAEVITSEVVDKGRRCVTVGGGSHFFRNLPVPNVVSRLEQTCPVSVVHTHAVATTPSVEQCVAGWPRPSIVATRHVAYGRLPATAVIADQLPGGVPADLTVADIADHVLFLGHRRDLTAAVPEWEVFFEPTYWAELNRRAALTGLPVDLSSLRQEADPAMFPEER
jgi:hypothetical protein